MILFLGIALPPSMQAFLSGFAPPVTKNIRPVKRHLMHLTLHYIGEADPNPIKVEISKALNEHALGAFHITLKSLGCFGSVQQPSVLFVQPEFTNTLVQLHGVLAHVLHDLGLPVDERKYHPHITLARVKRVGEVSEKERLALRDFYQQGVGECSFHVMDFILFESAFTELGREYREVERFCLEKT